MPRRNCEFVHHPTSKNIGGDDREITVQFGCGDRTCEGLNTASTSPAGTFASRMLPLSCGPRSCALACYYRLIDRRAALDCRRGTLRAAGRNRFCRALLLTTLQYCTRRRSAPCCDRAAYRGSQYLLLGKTDMGACARCT